MILTLDGETVVSCRPVMGYLHRSVEKLAESRTYLQNVIFTDRLDYLAPMTTNLPYAMATEALGNMQVPERAEYIRVIMCELQRFASHCVAIGTFASDAGVSDGLDGGAAAAPREPGLTSHTPVKSGSFARAAQSAAVGALGVNFCARAISLDTPNSPHLLAPKIKARIQSWRYRQPEDSRSKSWAVAQMMKYR